MDNQGQADSKVELTSEQDTKVKVTWPVFQDMMVTAIEKLPVYDTYVGIANGGIVIAGMLANYHDKRFSFMHIRHYLNQHRFDKAKFGGMFGRTEGKILLVDDIADTGETLEMAKEMLPIADTFALFKKPTSKFKPDYFITETDRWVVYPWEKE